MFSQMCYSFIIAHVYIYIYICIHIYIYLLSDSFPFRL